VVAVSFIFRGLSESNAHRAESRATPTRMKMRERERDTHTHTHLRATRMHMRERRQIQHTRQICQMLGVMDTSHMNTDRTKRDTHTLKKWLSVKTLTDFKWH
jgi:hypothetical protein